MKNDLQGALARAKSENKRVFVAFTGYACTNCHWMKANMFTRPEMAEAMSQFVLVELYTDGTDAASDTNQKSPGMPVQNRGHPVLRRLRCRPASCRPFRRAYPQRIRLLRLSSYSMKTVLSVLLASAAAFAQVDIRGFSAAAGTGAT